MIKGNFLSNLNFLRIKIHGCEENEKRNESKKKAERKIKSNNIILFKEFIYKSANKNLNKKVLGNRFLR